MRLLFLLLLLLPLVHARTLTYIPGDPDLICTSGSPCEKLGEVNCVGKETNLVSYNGTWLYRWDCSFTTVPGYIVNTRVEEDHATLRVDMTRRVPKSVSMFRALFNIVTIACYPKIGIAFMIGRMFWADTAPALITSTSYS